MSHESTEPDTQDQISLLLQSLDLRAPASLHASVRELVDSATPVRARSARALLSGALPSRLGARALAGASGLAAVAALVLTVVLLTGSGTNAAPTVLQASALAQRTATLAAPAENPHVPGQLMISAEGIPYPYWGNDLGWQTAGARSDRMDGRRVLTVFYTSPSPGAQPSTTHRVGYAIVSGPVLPVPREGTSLTMHGISYRILTDNGATVLTWRRAGHTCILVGSGVSAHTLLTLAHWQAS